MALSDPIVFFFVGKDERRKTKINLFERLSGQKRHYLTINNSCSYVNKENGVIQSSWGTQPFRYPVSPGKLLVLDRRLCAL